MEHGALLGSIGDGAISGATRADYAEAAATVLTGEVSASQVYELAGNKAFTLSDVAAVLSEVADRPVAYQDLAEASYSEALVGAGVPAAFAAALAEYSAKAAGGILADDTRTLDRGRVSDRPLQMGRDYRRPHGRLPHLDGPCRPNDEASGSRGRVPKGRTAAIVQLITSARERLPVLEIGRSRVVSPWWCGSGG